MKPVAITTQNMSTSSKSVDMKPDPGSSSADCFELLASAIFKPHDESGIFQQKLERILNFPKEDLLTELKSLAGMNHVIMRAFPHLRSAFAGRAGDLAQALDRALEQESERIRYAIPFLHRICSALEAAGNVIVIKSLDHWPDLGSDLDLYTDAAPSAILEIMRSRFRAQVEEQSWGDRLANKWNFAIPDLPELIEVHVGRLGQTGEQKLVGESLVRRSNIRNVGGYQFRTSAAEERILISTLQRMYRHFYIRLCDVLELAELMDAGAVDYEYLHSLSNAAGLWAGVATHLRIVSEYVGKYRGSEVPVPNLVREAAQFGTEKVSYRKGFLRIPIMPHSAKLYVGELGTLLSLGQISETLRLSLLPALATAAAIKQGITNSDKGIW